MRPTVEERIDFGSPRLEGVLEYREDEAARRGVLLLSPHPQFAGNLDNNVVRYLAADLVAAGHAVLRFNYRGVGESDIELAAGETAFDYWQRVEAEKLYEPIVADADSALGYLRRSLAVGDGKISLVGYSFGAIIGGLLACRREGVAGLAAIAPPLRRYAFDFLRGSAVRKGFFFSTRDFLYDEEDIEKLRGVLGDGGDGGDGGCSTTMVTADDHFFRGAEPALAARVRGFLGEGSG